MTVELVDTSLINVIIAALSTITALLGFLFAKTHVDKTVLANKVAEVNVASQIVLSDVQKLLNGQPVPAEDIKRLAANVTAIVAKT